MEKSRYVILVQCPPNRTAELFPAIHERVKNIPMSEYRVAIQGIGSVAYFIATDIAPKIIYEKIMNNGNLGRLLLNNDILMIIPISGSIIHTDNMKGIVAWLQHH